MIHQRDRLLRTIASCAELKNVCEGRERMEDLSSKLLGRLISTDAGPDSLRVMIPVNEPLLNGNEAKYLAECIETGWISSEGPFVRRLEEGMATVSGQRHGIAVMNGS